jgi:hypothetical protein
MDPADFKSQLFDHCVKILNDKANHAKNAMEEHQQMANEYGPPKDRYDSFRTQLLRKRDLFAEQYLLVLQELKLLEALDLKRTHNKVEFGAYVVTSAQNLFIATGIGQVKVGDETVFVISTKVPVYQVISGLKASESYQFNGKTFVILSIF